MTPTCLRSKFRWPDNNLSPVKLRLYFTLWAVWSILIWRWPPVTPWELSVCPVVISQVTEGLALMLSGGACWSLWERLSVWTTLTAQASRVLIIQLNPDHADWARRACASAYLVVTNTHTHSWTHGRPPFPPMLSQLPVTWGHTAVSADRPLRWEQSRRFKELEWKKLVQMIIIETKTLAEKCAKDYAKGPILCEILCFW